MYYPLLYSLMYASLAHSTGTTRHCREKKVRVRHPVPTKFPNELNIRRDTFSSLGGVPPQEMCIVLAELMKSKWGNSIKLLVGPAPMCTSLEPLMHNVVRRFLLPAPGLGLMACGSLRVWSLSSPTQVFGRPPGGLSGSSVEIGRRCRLRSADGVAHRCLDQVGGIGDDGQDLEGGRSRRNCN